MFLFCRSEAVVDVGAVGDKGMGGGRQIAEEVDIYRKFTSSRLHWGVSAQLMSYYFRYVF